MIPYKDDNPTHHLPVVTFALIVLNVGVWILVQGMGSDPAFTDSVCSLGVVPAALLGDMAALEAGYCDRGPQSWIVVVTSMFMHGGWVHLIGNMWFLWLFADNIEDVLRPVKFILFYLLGGLAAVGAHLLANGDSAIPMVGASGAIGGVMGAYAWLYPTVKVRVAVILGFLIMDRHIPAWVMLGIWLAIQVVAGVFALSSETPAGVAFWAHVGGFLAGFLLIQLFYRSPPLASELQ